MAKKAVKQPKSLPYAGWSPIVHGVSQSLLQKFTGCQDRFHKHAVLGLREISRKEAMEYGTIYHKLIEFGSGLGKKYTRDALMKLMIPYVKKTYPSTESTLLARVAIAQYHVYREWEKTREKQYTYIAQEPVFDEKYKLPPCNFNPNDTINIRIPSGITFRLRGRIDEIVENNGMWIQENKTKSQINESLIQETIHANLQVMFYAICSELKYGRPCKGVIYNVIRKPGERQRQNESDTDFINRISENCKADPEHYFKRYEYTFKPGEVQRWEREELRPLLYRVYLWWKSIESNPLEPWQDKNGNVNPFHGRKSFGIYDSMSLGKGDFYDLIVNGKKIGLTKVDELFPELQDEE